MNPTPSISILSTTINKFEVWYPNNSKSFFSDLNENQFSSFFRKIFGKCFQNCRMSKDITSSMMNVKLSVLKLLCTDLMLKNE